MVYNIIIGRDEKDKEKFGDKGLILLGKQYVKMGEFTSLSNNVYMDIARSHVILVSGKRGSGKSYSLGSIAENIVNLPDDVSKNLAVLIFDTMGIFWSMKFPNLKEEDNLKEWGLKPQGLKVKVYVPKGHFQDFKKSNIPVDSSFALRPNELSGLDWCSVFNVHMLEPIGILIAKTIKSMNGNYNLNDVIKKIENDDRAKQEIKDAASSLFRLAESWGLFDKQSTEIKDIVKGKQVSILDLSVYKDWNIKTLVTSLISKKLLEERILIRKLEELENIKSESHYFDVAEAREEMPLVWLMIDEAHEFLPREGKSLATDALVSLLREGRQPGISVILATQQPGEIHYDAITQSDIVISLRVTARRDIEALNNIMQTYSTKDVLSYLNNLPKIKGSAMLLDDNSERIYPIQIKPKMSWHGGETPTAVKLRKEILEM